jgi:hypothetical protein
LASTSTAAFARASRDASRARSRVAALLRQRRHQSAQPRTGERGIAIGWIVGKVDAGLGQRRDEFCLRNFQQRSRQQDAVALALTRHGGKARDAAAAQQPHQQRLGLVVPCMCGHNVFGATLASDLGQQGVARLARRGRQSALRLRAAPAQGAVFEIEALRKPLDVACLTRGIRA